MARPDPAIPLLVPSEARRGRDSAVGADRPRLRLVVARGQLAIELDAPFELGPLSIDELEATLPDVRFPVELSGGAAAFRNKRGRLERMVVRLPTRALHRFCKSRWEGVLPGTLCHHLLAPLDDGWLVGLATESAALAFELLVAPLDGDIRLLIVEARGVGLGAPPQTLAARALAALLKPFGVVVGAALVLEAPAVELVRELTPLAGMRAPDARGIRWTDVANNLEGTVLRGGRDEPPYAPSPRVIRAVEAAALTADAEDALLAGNLDRARQAYLAALTSAPRHPEIARRLAALDAVVGSRQEAALATLGDVLPPVEAGPLGAALLAAVGDHAGAAAAWQRAAHDEPYGPLAALCWLELAALQGALGELHEARGSFDHAIARAPGLSEPRWQHFALVLRLGRIDQARADVEHLVAGAQSAHERHRVLRRAADTFLEHRALDAAAEMFERALRYTPDSIDAVAGLARTLKIMGHERRALELLSRATALAAHSGRRADGITIEMAIALAEIADDRPAAIARVSGIESFAAAVFQARACEARWRAQLGDLSGASVALGQLAAAVEVTLGVLVGEHQLADGPHPELWGVAEASPYASRDDARSAIAELLLEGARIHELDRNDLHAARRMLALAVRLSPQHAAIRGAFRRVAAAVDPVGPSPQASSAQASSAQPSSAQPTPRILPELHPEPSVWQPPLHSAVPPTPVLPIMTLPDTDSAEALVPSPMSVTMDEAGTWQELPTLEDEALAEELTDKVRANPNDGAAAKLLADVLERLHRDHELLALLSARVDETGGAERDAWLARREGVLQRLIDSARAQGREDEAQLYALMLQRS